MTNGLENWATFLTLEKKNFCHFGLTENFDLFPFEDSLVSFP